jgi:hypothetical protein
MARIRRGRDRGRVIETWWYHAKTGRVWKDEKSRPHLWGDEKHMAEELESVDIRFHKEEGFFFVDIDESNTITDESICVVRSKLSDYITKEAASKDDDWEDKILVSDYSDYEDYFLGVGFTHVAIKGDYYRTWDKDGKKLGARMETTQGNTFLDYDEKLWRHLVEVSKAAESIRQHYGHVLIFGNSKRFDKRLLTLAKDIEDAFRKLPKKQRETTF